MGSDVVGNFGAHQVAQRAGEFGVERPAGGEHKLLAARVRVDAGGIPADDGSIGDAEAKALAVAARDQDRVTDAHAFEKGEVGVAVRRVDGGALLAGLGRALDWPLPPASATALAPSRGTSMRATGQVSAQDHGLTAAPVAMLAADARSSSTWASNALAWM